MVKKLRAAIVERQSIIQVTGHANEKSLNDYDKGSEREQQQLSQIISRTPQTATCNSFPGLPMWSFPSTSTEQVHSTGKQAPMRSR